MQRKFVRAVICIYLHLELVSQASLLHSILTICYIPVITGATVMSIQAIIMNGEVT